MRTSESHLYPLLNQVNEAAAGGLHLIAIATAVALPDICVSLISEDGRTDGRRYKQWCADNLGPTFGYLTPDDLYSMRCGVLHNGRFGDMKHDVGRVIFAPPGQGTFTDCVLNDAYFYGVVEFCRNMTDAVFRWYEANRENPVVIVNSDRLMRYRPQGFPPYVVGMPVIA